MLHTVYSCTAINSILHEISVVNLLFFEKLESENLEKKDFVFAN